jgi:rubrerythrin
MRSPKDIYHRFVNFEEQAAAIYLRMASRFSPEDQELGSFLLDMAMQEKQHAGLLQFCLEEELFATQLPGEKEIHDVEVLFSHLMKQASAPDLTVQQAFRIAIDLEASEVNNIYDILTTPMHASMYLLRRKIATSVPGHLQHLLEEARRHNMPREVIGKLERAVAKDLSE